MKAQYDSRTWRALTVISAVICLSLGLAAAAAGAAETFTFNPTLSLTGNCPAKASELNEVDEVPDPGCPGGQHPPAGPFASPDAVGTDGHGDIYVASQLPFASARFDVFSPTGMFLTEKVVPGLEAMTVDSQGVVYAAVGSPGITPELLVFRPTTYRPEAQEIAYGTSTSLLNVSEGLSQPTTGLAVDPSNDHLLVVTARAQGSIEHEVREFASAAEGSSFLGSPVPSALLGSTFPIGPKQYVAVGKNHEIYVSMAESNFTPSIVEVFARKEPAVEGSEYELARTIDGSNTPNHKFGSNGATSVTIAVDQTTGNVFVSDIGTESASATKRAVYEFAEDGEYLSTIRPPRGSFEPVVKNVQIAIDNGEQSPNRGDLMVPSSTKVPGRMLVFEPARTAQPPVVETFELSGITNGEASMSATIQKNGSAASYRFEYTTAAAYAGNGFGSAVVAGSGTLVAGFGAAQVSTITSGLTPGGHYVARVTVRASGCEEAGCESEVVRPFATYPEGVEQGLPCANAAFRGGPSGSLPDCRAYELVSPSDTGGHQLVGPGLSAAAGGFGTPVATVDGGSVAFTAAGGSIPGLSGVGSLLGSAYLAQRTTTGWATFGVEPSGSAATLAYGGVLSPDHAISLESVQEGEMQLETGSIDSTNYVRYPDGRFELVGVGSLGVEPRAVLKYISPVDNRMFFETAGRAQQLEPEGPPTGIAAIYERTPGGPTTAVSVLPGGAVPNPSQSLGTVESVAFARDGSVVSFRYGGVQEAPLYARVDGRETVEVGPAGAVIEGISADGEAAFYLLNGNLYRFAPRTGATEEIVSSGDATIVNVAESGEAVYFLSPSVLDGGANPVGNFAEPGKENLYLWRPGSTRFVSKVTQRDVEGERLQGQVTVDGLGLWQQSLATGEPAIVSDKLTASGSVLLFESRGPVTGYESKASASASEGEAELYRYDAGREELTCVSCDPTEQRPAGSASLLSLEIGFFPRNPMSIFSIVPNLSESGDRIVFQSPDPLVPEDTNQTQDVYEWEATGTGSCAQSGGCLALLSSGASSQPSFLFGASDNGDDAFILTSDQLTRSDQDATASIYDARVGGGFAEAAPAPACEGEGCRPPLSSAPGLAAPSTSSVGASGNVPTTKPVQKKKHKKKKHKKSAKKKTPKKGKRGGKR